MKVPRSRLINIHLSLAAFFFPFALMFLVTGALYTLSIKGASTSRQETIALAEPLKPELDSLVAVASSVLDHLNEPKPSGDPSIRKAGLSFQLEWSGIRRDVVLKPTANPGEALLVINKNNFHRQLVQLHKAKGNAFGKTLSIAWTLGLAAIFISGLSMAWGVPAYRRLALISAAAGALLFLAYLLLA